MIPKTALLTGNLLEWQKANIKALFVMFKKQHGNDYFDYDYWKWLYQRLERNQKHVKKSLKLGHFFPCKDRKRLEKPKEYSKWIGKSMGSFGEMSATERKRCIEWDEAKKKVIFDGCKLDVEGFIIIESQQKSIDYYEGKFRYKSIEQLITQIPDISITDNYYKHLIKN